MYMRMYKCILYVCVCIDVDFVSHVCLCEGDCYTSVYVYEMVGVQINMFESWVPFPEEKDVPNNLHSTCGTWEELECAKQWYINDLKYI